MRGMSLAALIALVLIGCSSSSKYMAPSSNPEIGPPPAGKARIVFIRPSSYAGNYVPTILDGNAQFVGDAVKKSKFAVDVAPGEHTFVIWGEGTRPFKANVAAGKTYYIEVSSGMGLWSASFTLWAIKPSMDNWGDLQGWLAKMRTMEPNMSAGRAYVNSRSEDARSVVQKGLGAWDKYDAEERNERSVAPDDGV